jgi:hypothetical protein
MFTRRIRRTRPAPLLNERGQGLALLIFGMAILFAVCLIAKGRLF